jgi:hypothetical protein
MMASLVHWNLTGRVSIDEMRREASEAEGLARHFCRSFPPASEREARMDDPTRRCENDTGIETCLPGLPSQAGAPLFYQHPLH